MGTRVNRTFLVAPDGLEVRGNIEAVALCDFAELFPRVFQGEPDLFAVLAKKFGVPIRVLPSHLPLLDNYSEPRV